MVYVCFDATVNVGLRSLGRGVDERRPNRPIGIGEWQEQAKKVVTKLLQTAKLY